MFQYKFHEHINKFYNYLKLKEEKKISNNAIIIKGISRSIQLDRFSCAAHSVKSILDFYGIKNNIPGIIRLLGTDAKEGTDTEPILKLFQKFNLDFFINENADLTDIRKYLKRKIPLLITVDDWEHWVVIYGISNEKVFILDSYSLVFSVGLSLNEFINRWDDNWICGIKLKQ